MALYVWGLARAVCRLSCARPKSTKRAATGTRWSRWRIGCRRASVAVVLLRCRGSIQQDVALDADLLDQIELAFEEIDMLLFAVQDLQEQVAGNEIAHAFAIGDGFAQIRQSPF